MAYDIYKYEEKKELLILAESLYQQANYLRLINVCKNILEIDETDWYALVTISDCFLKLEKDKLAEPYVYKAYQLYNDDVVAINLSSFLIGTEDYNNAIAILEEKKRNESPDDLVYNNLGVAYESIEKYIEALDNYTISIQLEEHNPLAYFNRGVLKYETFNDKDGIEDIRKAELYGSYDAAMLLYKIDKTRLS